MNKNAYERNERNSQWIPCEERLPENGQYVIGWCNGHINIVRFEAGISMEDREKMKNGELKDPIITIWCRADGTTEAKRSELYNRSDEFGNNEKPYCWVNGQMEYMGQYVTAWMPLPEDYKKEKYGSTNCNQNPN